MPANDTTTAPVFTFTVDAPGEPSDAAISALARLLLAAADHAHESGQAAPHDLPANDLPTESPGALP